MIDDDHVIRKLYTDFFAAREQYELIVAADPGEGFSKAREVRPDLIILDLVLPKNLMVTVEQEEINKEFGYNLLKDLKIDQTTKNIPIIIFSNLAGDQDRRRALAEGAIEYVEKTNSLPSELLASIEKVLGKQAS